MGKRNRRNRAWFNDNYWESADYNFRAVAKNLDMLLSIALNRFRWVGLPETCDARYLEKILHRNGIATLSYREGDSSPVFTTLQAMPQGEYNMYGLPTRWRAVGYDGLTDYSVTPETGELCYYSYARVAPWNALEMYARKMAHYERTEDVNLTQQMRPFIGIAPQEKRQELVNLIKQVQGGEPAILGDNGLMDMVERITVIDTKVPIITEELAQGYQNCLNAALLYLGVPHLAFEKGERMIEHEAKANTAPTNLQLLDCLNARREFCDKVNRKFGLDVHVYYNEDLESYNYNYTHNLEQMAQDGLIDQESGLDNTENFYRIMSIVKDLNRGDITDEVAVRMLESLNIETDEAKRIIAANAGAKGGDNNE